MQVIITKKEITEITNTATKLLTVVKDLSKEDIDIEEEIDKLFEQADHLFDEEGNLTLTIPEEKVCLYLEIVGDMYKLIGKVAKIVIPTVEFVKELCKDDFTQLLGKIEKLSE